MLTFAPHQMSPQYNKMVLFPQEHGKVGTIFDLSTPNPPVFPKVRLLILMFPSLTYMDLSCFILFTLRFLHSKFQTLYRSTFCNNSIIYIRAALEPSLYGTSGDRHKKRPLALSAVQRVAGDGQYATSPPKSANLKKKHSKNMPHVNSFNSAYTYGHLDRFEKVSRLES